jgi:undecaprenyl-diphosphatase
VYLTLAVLSYQLLKRNSHRGIIFVIAAAIVSLIGLSRIYLGVHYPSDVLAGILLGTSWALLVSVFFHRLFGADTNNRR